MQMFCFKRAGTLTKGEPIDKFLSKVSYVICVVLINSYANIAQAAAIPVTLTWFQPQARAGQYLIEISDDARFGTSVAKTEVSTNRLNWQAPKEGVYHWRVTPIARLDPAAAKDQMVETSSVASGSFVAIDSGPENSEPVALRWSDDPSITAYHLKIQEDGRDARVTVSLLPNSKVIRGPKPLVIQVVPHSGSNTHKIARGAVARFDPNLTIVPKIPEAPLVLPSRELIVGDQPNPKEETKPYEALPPPPSEVVLKSAPREEVLLPENRVMELLVSAYFGTEKNYSASGPTATRYAKGNVSGGMLSYRAIPFPGLHLQARGHAHGRQSNWRDENGANVIDQQTSSYFGEVGIGWDVMFRNPNRRHQLVFDIRGAMTSIYDMPVETVDLASPNLKRQDLQLWGGGMWYRWTARQWGAGGHVASMVQTTNRSDHNDSGLNEWNLFLAVDPKPFMTISLGAMNRLTVARRCSTDATSCATNGVAAARSSLIAGYVGLGYVIY